MRTHAVKNLTTKPVVLCGGVVFIPAGGVGHIPDDYMGHPDVVSHFKHRKIERTRVEAPVKAPDPVVEVPVEVSPVVESKIRARRRVRGISGTDSDNPT